MSDLAYVCPACSRGRVVRGTAQAHCDHCARGYPIVRGVLDLRLPGDEPQGAVDDRMVQQMLQVYDVMGFAELVGFCYSSEGLQPALYELFTNQDATNRERGDERLFQIRALLGRLGRPLPGGHLALDVGCGTGNAVRALAGVYSRVVGVDVCLHRLLLATKYLDEVLPPERRDAVTLLCAAAERLPFAGEVFDLVNAADVIEHVAHQEQALFELRRVLGPGGMLFFNSANRYNLFSPEPHVKLWGVGWLPRRLMNGYVRLRRDFDYSEVHLLSLAELSRLLSRVFPGHHLIEGVIMDLSRPQGSLKGRLVRRLPGALSLANHYLKPFLTQYQVAAYK